MKDPKYSIIIPCYNGRDYLRECLLSLKNQLFQDYEVIFVDDNSADGSYDYALSLKRELELVGEFFQKDQSLGTGVSSSRNLALERAKGEWVVFLDCDDYFVPEKLQRINDFINQNPEAFAIHHAFIKFGSDISSTIVEVQNDLPHDFNMLIKGNPIGTSTVSIKRRVILEMGGFNTNLNGVEDYFLWSRIANKMGAWSYINEPLTYYRFIPSSLMSQRRLSYYVNQMIKFSKEARICGEYTETQLRIIKKQLFFEQLNYKIKISLDNYGILDFLNGSWVLLKEGENKVVFHHIFIRLRNFVLFYLAKIFKPLVSI
ncbi:glycosyltransferase [Algoriphagus sp.]|uniref:glycosyltransferase family 2 protein n=1 Tax=Algoriphagus sp. TaxID=1872435 RepID=UPI0026365EBF|nr:glycosyltransferase [Algoriphagus sp.]